MDNFFQMFPTVPFDPTVTGQGLWMIIAYPLAGALLCGLLGKTLGRANTHLIALGSVGTSFVLSVLAYWATCDRRAVVATPIGLVPWSVHGDFGTWFAAGSFKVNFGLSVDHLSGIMLLVITGVGFLIHMYSTEYMSDDKGYWRFFSYLNLFVAAMLTLVLADSLPLLFVGWEGVGLCSYLLIGFWYEDKEKAYAGRKAFITNRIGDFGFVVAAILMVLLTDAITQSPVQSFGREPSSAVFASRYQAGIDALGALSFPVIAETARTVATLEEQTIASGPLSGHSFQGVVTVTLLLFMLGAAGKSAQIPLYVWLPDAMAGPTPVSALIHAATMVTSGVYLFCRISALLVLSPTAMATIALIGAVTALWAALIAFSQVGIKKILAYSTVSQLGFMFLGIGTGAFWAAFLHLVTHAFFKACLFLGAGSVMHGNAGEEDITKLGAVRKEMPLTWATFLVATFAITGIVPLSGFFSKDAILHAAHSNVLTGYPMVLSLAWVIGTVAAFGTAFYMMRLYFLTFEGKRSPAAKVAHAHESGPAITVPLVILAALAVLAVVQGIPFLHTPEGLQTVFQAFLRPVFSDAAAISDHVRSVHWGEENGVPWGTYLFAWCIALAGGAFAFIMYKRNRRLPRALEPFRRASFAKFYIDEGVDILILRPLRGLSMALYRVVDAVLIDGFAVRGTAWVTARAGAALRYFQTGDAQTYAAVMVLALVAGILWALMKVAS